MKNRILLGIVTALGALVPGLATAAAPTGKADLDQLAGQPVDLAPWAYAWHADLAAQEKPEAYFIPHRLERLDNVYRTAYTALPQDQLKSIYYNMPDLLKPLLPAPKGRLQAGLLWTGGLAKYQVELRWPANVQTIPAPETVEVQLPDPRWTEAWRAGSAQLKGKHMWGGLAFEVGRVAHEMELIGLHDEADKVLELLHHPAQGLAQRQHLPASGRCAELPEVLDECIRVGGQGGWQVVGALALGEL